MYFCVCVCVYPSSSIHWCRQVGNDSDSAVSTTNEDPENMRKAISSQKAGAGSAQELSCKTHDSDGRVCPNYWPTLSLLLYL